MKAVSVRHPGGLDRLELVDLEEPRVPRPGEVTVRIRASSINYHDYLVVAGKAPAADKLIPLSDGAGDIVAVGDGVTEYKKSDRVISTFFPEWVDGEPPNRFGREIFASVPGDGADGYAREYVTAPASAFTPAPKGFSYAESACLVCAGLTAWRALVVEAHVKAGDIVLVQGTGGVSIFALQFAKAMGATVIATSSSDEKIERLRALGADHLINYKTEPKWGSAARAITGGRGVDHVVEIGGPGTLGQSIAATRPGGFIGLIGILTGMQGSVPTAMLIGKQIRLIGLTVGSRLQQQEMIRAIDATHIKPVIDRHFPLEALADGFRYQAAGRHFGKIAVDV